MYSEIQRERADIGGLMARPEYREWNPELIKPKKLLNPVKASRSHQELHRELLMNHRRGLGVDSKPELQRVLEHRRRNQIIKKKKEELEAKRLQCPFEQELLRRQQRLSQLEKPPEKEEDHAPAPPPALPLGAAPGTSPTASPKPLTQDQRVSPLDPIFQDLKNKPGLFLSPWRANPAFVSHRLRSPGGAGSISSHLPRDSSTAMPRILGQRWDLQERGHPSLPPDCVL
uniref:Actin-associated protein FAM107A n=1 Tax=Pipistrellus kuhlii TaxID=59472 RepID=A0A7J7WCI0_PIPKU|nr:family with sequence similarity 107 member A [Pipistrellus kuhlii]